MQFHKWKLVKTSTWAYADHDACIKLLDKLHILAATPLRDRKHLSDILVEHPNPDTELALTELLGAMRMDPKSFSTTIASIWIDKYNHHLGMDTTHVYPAVLTEILMVFLTLDVDDPTWTFTVDTGKGELTYAVSKDGVEYLRENNNVR